MAAIYVRDAIMGSGKTTNAIDIIKRKKPKYIIFAVPYLGETQRVMWNTRWESILLPPRPNSIDTFTKSEALKDMLDSNQRITMTHSLLQRIKPDYYPTLNKYTLILDEVVDPIEILQTTKSDIKLLVDSKLISDNPSRPLIFNDPKYKGTHSDLKKDIERGDIYNYADKYLLRLVDPNLFRSFHTIYITTYRFEYSTLRYYFDFYGIAYEIKKKQDRRFRERARELINIYQGKSNELGSKRTAFSLSWYKKGSDEDIRKLKEKVRGVFYRVFKSDVDSSAFTTFKDYKEGIGGKEYEKKFIELNARAKNKYANKKSLAYLVNRFMNPDLKRYFKIRGVVVDEKNWALSEMIQWIYRSAIRNDEPIDIYIPSKRMRNLLEEWLDV
jgi:hypothetical protein